MATWQLRIARYNSKLNPTSRLSGTQHLEAKDFDDASSKAELIVHGMRAADPASDYRIFHLSSHDYRGVDCEGGIHPFETREEMSERLAAQAAGN